MVFYTITVLLLFHLTIYQAVNSSWWYLSNFDNESITDPKLLCLIFPRNTKQHKICEKYSDLVFSLGESSRRAISECQYQFRSEKWNCSVFERNFSIFGNHFVKGGTRELSFVQAMATSSAVYTISKACSLGYFTCECKSESEDSNSVFAKNEFKWRECMEGSIDFSLRFVRRFTDAEEKYRRDTKAKVTLHNNRAGREIFLLQSSLRCKCHGISGSCSMKTCWRLLPNLREIGNTLKQKYDAAVKITLNPSARLVPIDHLQKKPNKWDLVYYEDSPDYCSIDPSKGLFGTGHRICNETSEETDGCDLLCCGKGFYSYRHKVVSKCECIFRWCCEVKCSVCQEWKAEAKCKPSTSSVTIRNRSNFVKKDGKSHFPGFGFL